MPETHASEYSLDEEYAVFKSQLVLDYLTNIDPLANRGTTIYIPSPPPPIPPERAYVYNANIASLPPARFDYALGITCFGISALSQNLITTDQVDLLFRPATASTQNQNVLIINHTLLLGSRVTFQIVVPYQSYAWNIDMYQLAYSEKDIQMNIFFQGLQFPFPSTGKNTLINRLHAFNILVRDQMPLDDIATYDP